MPHQIQNEDLVVHMLNVGKGDTILIEFPADSAGKRSYGLVDCYKSDKTINYLKNLRDARPGKPGLKFLCATHPHSDHIAGIRSILRNPDCSPEEFWDSGFRHNSKTYHDVLEEIRQQGIRIENAGPALD